MSPALKSPKKPTAKPAAQAHKKKPAPKKPTAPTAQPGQTGRTKLSVNPSHEETNWLKEAIKDQLCKRLSAAEVNRLTISDISVAFSAEGPKAILTKIAAKPKPKA